MDTSGKEPPEDPRAKSNRYSKGARAKFEMDHFDFMETQFLIDDHYVGTPPSVQVSIENLNDNIDENFLRNEITKIRGKIREGTLEIIRNPKTGQHLGLARVQFAQVSMAQAFVDTFDSKKLMGLVLSVYKDLRFARIERVKEEKLNPKPIILPPSMQQNHLVSSIAMPNMTAAPVILQNPTLPPHLLPPISHHLHQQQPRMPKSNNLNIPSPHSLEYSMTTPSSIISTPEPSNRQRLEDRIANLLKQPNSLLSTIVQPNAPQASPTYSAFNDSSYYHPSIVQPSPMGIHYDKHRAGINNHYQRKPDNNDHQHHLHHHHHNSHHHNSHYYQGHEKANDRSEHESPEHNSSNSSLVENVKKPLDIVLTELAIEVTILPYCLEKFIKELNECSNISEFKRLREKCGFQLLAKAKEAYQDKVNKEKLEKERAMFERKRERELEMKYYSRSLKNDRQQEEPRLQRPTFMRQNRNIEHGRVQDDRRRPDTDSRRRINRSSALVVSEVERRGSHTTSLESDFSDDENSSSSSSLSRSSSPSSPSSASVSSSVYPHKRPKNSYLSSSEHYNSDDSSSSSQSSPSSYSSSSDEEGETTKSQIEMKIDNDRQEQEAAEALLSLGNDASESKQLIENDLAKKIVESPPKTGGKKRKKMADEIVSITSEYKGAKKKRFTNNSSGGMHLIDDIVEDAVDENFYEEKVEERYTFPKRSEAEKQRLLDDLIDNLDEEDIKILEKVHQENSFNKNNDVQIPFGSMAANMAHLNMRKNVIEGKAMERHPKWWRGCSRCDVIKASEKKKDEVFEKPKEQVEKRAEIDEKHEKPKQRESIRREQRGNQRRMINLNEAIDKEFLKSLMASTLQMRAKNLRFSRSAIHNWGLFACEDIAAGEAVIEYVGEKIRPSLADHREKNVYATLPTHDGSSYFFRVDAEVIDATLKGNHARFINHSCNPNCIAKVIKHDNGSNSIVIYAKQAIKTDDEITYDYKFPREEGVDKIICRCQAPNCQKHLN